MFFFPALVVLKIMLNSILVRAWRIRILLDMVVSPMEDLRKSIQLNKILCKYQHYYRLLSN